MTNAKWVMVLGITLLVGYFLPWVSFFLSVSGFDLTRMMLSGEGGTGTPVWAYLVPLLPVGAIAAIVCGARAAGYRPAAIFAGLIFPLLLVLALTTGMPEGMGSDGEGPSMLSFLGIGIYVCLAASVGLLVFGIKRG